LPKKDVQPSLTEEEFRALKEVADKPTHCAISNEHRERLIATGYIREVRSHSGKVYAVVPTRRGLKRLVRENYLPDVSSFDMVVPKKTARSMKHRDVNQNSEEHRRNGRTLSERPINSACGRWRFGIFDFQPHL
jgi:hypothetical protein